MFCAQCFIGAEKFPAAGKKLNYVDGNYSHVYEEIFHVLVILSLYITQNGFRSDNDCKLYAFDLRHQNLFFTPRTVELIFRFACDANEGIYVGYVLVSRFALIKISFNSDWQSHLYPNFI